MSIDLVPQFRRAAMSRRRMFWLDGQAHRPWSGNRSILGWLDEDDVSLTYDARRREVKAHRGTSSVIVGDDIFAALEEQMTAHQDVAPMWVGYFGYACRPDLPAQIGGAAGGRHVPDAIWMACRNPLVVDHPEPARLCVPSATPGDSSGVPAEYVQQFDRVQQELHAGNSYEVNLTYRQEFESSMHPAESFVRLRAMNPAPYSGYLQHDGTYLVSASPERFATIGPQRLLETRPIKGTINRSDSVELDNALAALLSTDVRYRAENLMIVDLLRNDLATVCRTGTVDVPDLMTVESYATVHQLVSTVCGRLRDDVSPIAALRALFPAGSMTGAPKRRTMQIIADVETDARGVYAGAFGWIGVDGRADLAVVIRSLIASRAGERFRYTSGTGGGITVRSDAHSEYNETLWKSGVLRSACGGNVSARLLCNSAAPAGPDGL
jgi:para-aminobenzoate synthetase